MIWLNHKLQLEDIYGSLFLVTCDNKLNREKHRLGAKQGMMIKFCSGVLLFAILIAVIWAPMLVFILPLSNLIDFLWSLGLKFLVFDCLYESYLFLYF